MFTVLPCGAWNVSQMTSFITLKQVVAFTTEKVEIGERFFVKLGFPKCGNQVVNAALIAFGLVQI